MFITNVHFDVPKGNHKWWPTFAGIFKQIKCEIIACMLGRDTGSGEKEISAL